MAIARAWRWLSRVLVLAVVTGTPSVAAAVCSPVSTFEENTAGLCATVLVVRVIESGKTLVDQRAATGADVVVEHTLKGRAPSKRLTLWHIWYGAPATPEHFPPGSRWVVMLRHYRDEYPGYDEERGSPIEYLLGGLSACTGPLVARLGEGGMSVESLERRFEREARLSIPTQDKECAAGVSFACYELACAHEQGLGTRRSAEKAAELYRRAFELESGDR